MKQFSTDVNEYTIQILDQPTPESHHIDISTNRYVDAIMDILRCVSEVAAKLSSSRCGDKLIKAS